MRRRLSMCSIIVPLSFLCVPAAWAQWTKVIETDTTVEYVDLATVEKRDNDYRRVWTVQDLKKRGGQGELSFRRHLEFNCQKRQYRIL